MNRNHTDLTIKNLYEQENSFNMINLIDKCVQNFIFRYLFKCYFIRIL